MQRSTFNDELETHELPLLLRLHSESLLLLLPDPKSIEHCPSIRTTLSSSNGSMRDERMVLNLPLADEGVGDETVQVRPSSCSRAPSSASASLELIRLVRTSRLRRWRCWTPSTILDHPRIRAAVGLSFAVVKTWKRDQKVRRAHLSSSFVQLETIHAHKADLRPSKHSRQTIASSFTPAS